jgi:hypothetical protein
MLLETQAAYSKLGIDVSAAGPAVDLQMDFRNADIISIDCVLTALTGGTAPTVQFILERLSADGVTWVQLSAPAAISAPNTTPSTGIVTFDVGPGLALVKLVGRAHRIRHITTGAPATAVATINAFTNNL